MRTTIDLPDDLHMQLVQAAARERRKGFSHIVQEALKQYFAGDVAPAERARLVAALRGSISHEAGEEMHARVKAMRASWR